MVRMRIKSKSAFLVIGIRSRCDVNLRLAFAPLQTFIRPHIGEFEVVDIFDPVISQVQNSSAAFTGKVIVPPPLASPENT